MATTPRASLDSSLYPRALFYPSPSSLCKSSKPPMVKHKSDGWSSFVSPPLAWFLMERPTLWLTLNPLPHAHHFHNPQTLTLLRPFHIRYF
ncbi:hypothetical protein AMTRI_Chr04g184630 [Amborella trichopoda]